ncbi:MAG: ATP-binding protein [Bacteroidota bacterium]|nr:ATP-binding protein [Bacteroidota bacterium]
MSNLFTNDTDIESHERLEEFLDNASVGIHLVDSNGTILYANKAELNLLGYKPEEYLGHNIADFHADKKTIEDIFSKLTGHEQLDNYEARLRCKDGSVREVLISSNVYWQQDKFVYTRCFTRDITDRKKAEKLIKFLNKASEELTTTLDTQEALNKIVKFIVPDYADWFTIDLIKNNKVELIKMAHSDPDKIEWAIKYREQNPVDLNDEKYGTTGYVAKTKEAVLFAELTDEMIEASAKNPEQLEILKNLSLKSAMVAPLMVKGEIMGVVSFISSNPGNKYDESDLHFAKDFANRIALTLENSRLYEEVRKDVERRIELDRIKDEFLSMASHELKTPVTSLKAFTQVLQMNFEKEDNHKAAALLSKMNKQIDKLNRLIVDLLDITKVDKGELIFDEEKFDFNLLVQEIAEEMQRTTQTHTIKTTLTNSVVINVDRNRIGQVITNFISNAIKYSPNANEIIVQSSACEKGIKLCVKDFGIGIPKIDQTNIFNRFYRVHGKDKQNTFPGLGLGLYISSQIIKKHSGTIEFKSEEGKGSEFCFTLPQIR